MKIYIVQELNQYSIYKVADHLLESFQKEKGENVIIEGKSVSEVVTKFDHMEKHPDVEFNAQLIKYKTVINEISEDDKIRLSRRIRF